jgi:hypothetical protein
MTQDYNNYYYIKSNYAAGYEITTTPCVLKSIIVNVSSLYTVGIVDATSGTTVNVGKIAKSATTGSYLYNCVIGSGLRVVVTGASTITPDITVVYRV